MSWYDSLWLIGVPVVVADPPRELSQTAADRAPERVPERFATVRGRDQRVT